MNGTSPPVRNESSAATGSSFEGEPLVALSIQINVSLSLPRDELTVPVVRHICRFSLREVGATESSVNDLELALTEACTNVLEHSGADDEYEVDIEICDNMCVIRVRDAGRGFDFGSVGEQPEPSAESGRGIGLMNALVDKVAFTSVPEAGMIVHLEKELGFDDTAPVRRRAAAVEAARAGGDQSSSTRR